MKDDLGQRRLVRVPISDTMLFETWVEGWESGPGIRCQKGLPKGSVFISSYFDEEKHCAYVVFSHPSFELVEAGAVIPVRDVWFERRASA